MKKKETKIKKDVAQEEPTEGDGVKKAYAKAVQNCRKNRNKQTISAMQKAYANAKGAGISDVNLYNIIWEIDKKRKRGEK